MSKKDIHVIPVDDLREHESLPSCWCKPEKVHQDGVFYEFPVIWVHHALDGREEYEQGRKMH